MARNASKKAGAAEPPVVHEAELVAIENLRPHPRNYRSHPQDQLAHIEASVSDYGVFKNVVIARDGTLLAGHGLYSAACARGIKALRAVRLPLDADDPRALKVLALDNEVAHLGIVDDRALTDMLRGFSQDAAIGLLGTGFDQLMLANLVYVTRPETEVLDFNAAREWVGLPAYDASDPARLREPALLITFADEKAREKFLEDHQIRVRTKTGARWHTTIPFVERADVKSIRFDSAKKAPAAPAPSGRRADKPRLKNK